MANRYRQTLNRWAAQHIPDGATVTEVVIEYDDGWDPTYGEGTASLDVIIAYRWDGATTSTTLTDEVAVVSSLGTLLTELFRIEEEPFAEWRATFEYPGYLMPSGMTEPSLGYGPWRAAEGEARDDRPYRPDETHGRIIGLQRRSVGPPENRPL